MWRPGSLWVAVLGISLIAADWPQWRGPNRDGVSSEAIEPWKGDLAVIWRQPVAEGHSSPVVAGGRVIVHAKVAGKDQEEVVAFDAKSGNRQWRAVYDRAPFSNPFGNGPRVTPLVDGGRVYTLGVTGVLACWEASSGKEQWKHDILKEFNAENLFFGVSSSPVVHDDKLLVMVGSPTASIVAFDKTSGEVAWKSGKDKASYASPIVTKLDASSMAIFLTQQGVVAANPSNGEQLWKYPLVDKLNESSTTPVRAGDILFASSVTVGSVGLRLTQKDNKPAYEEVWKNPQLTCYFSTPVVVGEHCYVVTGSLPPLANAKLHCVEAATGKVRWTRPKVGTYHATVLRAKDRLLMLEEEGQLVLIEPNAEEYKELARSKVCGQTWAHPALSDGRLFVRDGKELVCVDLKSAP